MKIIIKSITLTNFKCFRHKEITFSPDVTVIRGRNGVGKTTIADAILWCLFGKNTQAQSDFDLKTHDENGQPIPNLDHSVELSLVCDDSIITLTRTLKETWIKKRSSDEYVFKNNTTEYMINGEYKTATDYKRYISELVSEDIFRAITNPSYFPSLKWQQQRAFLSGLVDMSDSGFAPTKEELDGALSEIPSGQDIIAHRKHLSYQIKQIKDKLDKIPVRLEEQNKALPERLDWETLTVQYADASQQLKETESKILAIKSGNGDDVRREEIRKQLDEQYRNLRHEEESAQQRVFEQTKEHNAKVSELSAKFSSLLNTQRDLESVIPSFDRMIERCNETLKQCDDDAQTIRDEWKANESSRFVWQADESVCPTCGQYLPQEQLQERKTKAVENFNNHKAEIKQSLIERANKAKALIADTNEQIKDIEAKKSQSVKSLSDIKEKINSVFSEKQQAEKERDNLPTYEVLLDTPSHRALLLYIENLENELQSSSSSEEDTKALTDLEAQKVQYAETLSQLNNQLATRTQYDKILALIDGINEEQKNLVSQLSELERKDDIARQYQDRQNAFLEESINKHFSLVQWRLFRTVNNGGDPFDEPYCECYVDGVAYHDGLNQAARLNAGLDIIRTLCKHYDVSAPIVIDNSESNLNILSTPSQQIRLEVFNSDLQIQ